MLTPPPPYQTLVIPADKVVHFPSQTEKNEKCMPLWIMSLLHFLLIFYELGMIATMASTLYAVREKIYK